MILNCYREILHSVRGAATKNYHILSTMYLKKFENRSWNVKYKTRRRTLSGRDLRCDAARWSMPDVGAASVAAVRTRCLYSNVGRHRNCETHESRHRDRHDHTAAMNGERNGLLCSPFVARTLFELLRAASWTRQRRRDLLHIQCASSALRRAAFSRSHGFALGS